MKNITTFAAVGAVLTVFAAASPAYADGWERSRTITGPYGGERSFHGGGHCDDYGCSSGQQWTGPGGRTVTREGSSECYDGNCKGKAVWTGPNGNKTVVKRRFERW